MKDTTFYQALCRCYSQTKNCRRCPLFAQGYKENSECMQMLMNEISNRKSESLRKEEEHDLQR